MISHTHPPRVWDAVATVDQHPSRWSTVARPTSFQRDGRPGNDGGVKFLPLPHPSGTSSFFELVNNTTCEWWDQ